ncbi:MAG: hypothetical protein KDD47_26595, partial [Acidobacteria bacterium]|nr:hypothetical protein [Acidobacteriota bacterium]
LWRTDGTHSGTFPLLNRGFYPSPFDTVRPQEIFGSLVFVNTASAPQIGGVWRTDGTEEGTFRLTEGRPGSNDEDEGAFARTDHGLYFILAQILWRTDGTVEGTGPVPGVPYTDLADLSTNGSEVVLVGGGVEREIRLYSPDLGPRPVSGTPATFSHTVFTLGGKPFFVAFDNPRGNQLWTVDVEAGISRQVTAFDDGFRIGAGALGVAGDRVVLVKGNDLYTWPGSEGMAEILFEACEVPDLCFEVESQTLVSQGGRVFFTAVTEAAGAELWVTDGTSEGTRQLADACPGPCSGFPRQVQATETGVLFRPHDDDGGQLGIWTSDGSPEGTRRAARLPATGSSGEIGFEPWIAELPRSFVYSHRLDELGREPWSSPKGGGAPRLLANINRRLLDADPSYLGAAGPRVAFSARTEANVGLETWRVLGASAAGVPPTVLGSVRRSRNGVFHAAGFS